MQPDYVCPLLDENGADCPGAGFTVGHHALGVVFSVITQTLEQAYCDCGVKKGVNNSVLWDHFWKFKQLWKDCLIVLPVYSD